MENKYIILQKPKLKVPLLAGEGTWDVVISGLKYKVDIYLEALFASYIYDGDSNSTAEIVQYVVNRLDKCATPVHVENFIKAFKAAHPAEQLKSVSLQDVQLLGNHDEGCQIPIYKYVCAINRYNEEQWIMDTIANPSKAGTNLYRCIQKYISKYDQCFYPKWKEEREVKFIVESFVRMHGLPVELSKIPRVNKYNQPSNTKNGGIKAILAVFLFLATPIASFFLGLQLFHWIDAYVPSDSSLRFLLGVFAFIIMFGPSYRVAKILGIIKI